MSVGRELSLKYRVILVDQRNHGRSPHSPSHSYLDLAFDLLELIDELNLQRVTLIGHSMGGKAAILFTALNPQRVNSLVVVDILPTSYKVGVSGAHTQEKVHRNILSSLLLLNPDLAQSREEIDKSLSRYIPDVSVRQFLMKSLKRNERGSYSWVINIEALSQNLSELMDSVLPFPNFKQISIPTLFIKGDKSNYIHPSGEQELPNFFTSYDIAVVPNAGHWLHAENPKYFMRSLKSFLENT
jgi:pimeloyl-ACP methyl ester carboxylesterase